MPQAVDVYTHAVGIPVSAVRLVFSGLHLEDDSLTMEEYGEKYIALRDHRIKYFTCFEPIVLGPRIFLFN